MKFPKADIRRSSGQHSAARGIGQTIWMLLVGLEFCQLLGVNFVKLPEVNCSRDIANSEGLAVLGECQRPQPAWRQVDRGRLLVLACEVQQAPRLVAADPGRPALVG